MRRAMVISAAALAAVDLAQKALDPVYRDPRSLAYVALATLISVALVALVPRVPSRALALFGAIAVAGAIGDGLSPLLWSGAVPNPIVAGGLAFNVADVYDTVGAAGLVVGAALYALRNRHLLREPL